MKFQEPKWRLSGKVYYEFYDPNGKKFRSLRAAMKHVEQQMENISPGPNYEVATCDPSFRGIWEGDWEPCIVDAVRGSTISITCTNDRLQIEVHRRFVRKRVGDDVVDDETKKAQKKKKKKTKKRNRETTTTTTTIKKKRKSSRDTTHNQIIRILCTGLTRDQMREVLRLCGRMERVRVVSDFNRACPPTHLITSCDEDRYARRMF